MEHLYAFFQQNLILVYFIYGLVFFMMGFAIALQNDKPSSLLISRSFNYLAAFGIIHGLSEWGHVFIPIYETFASPEIINVLYFIEISLVGFSFVFLLFFGLKLSIDTLNIPVRVLWLPRIGGLLWFIVFILRPTLLRLPDVYHWYLLADIISRYTFALPGSLLSAYAIWKQRDDLFPLGEPIVIHHLRRTSVLFILYAVFAGLIVPRGPFFPANWLNIQALFTLTGIPVAVYRAAICTLIAYYVIRLTDIFRYEYRQQLSDAREDYAVLQERQRIRRNLHDGIMQEIYAVGLSLDNARHLITVDPEKAAQIITEENKHLDEVNSKIRRYVMDIQQSSFAEQSLKSIILGMVEQLKLRSNLPVELRIDDAKRESLTIEQKEHLYLIVQEIFSNIVRHSYAAAVTVSLSFHPQHLELRITDDGIGLPTEGAQRSGMQNILERAEAIGADIDIQSAKGKGTAIRLQIPSTAK